MQWCTGDAPMVTLGTLRHKGRSSHQMAPSLVPQITLPYQGSVPSVSPWRVHVYMRSLLGSDLTPWDFIKQVRESRKGKGTISYIKNSAQQMT